MNRNDFLAQLKNALGSDLSAQAVKEHVDYYNNYIQEEIQNGKSEQEVLDMLGDPWAIAKTILMSSGTKSREYNSDTSDVQEKRESNQKHANVHVFGLDSWWKKAAVVAVIIAVIAIIMSIVMGIIRLVAPVVIPVLVIWLVMKIWKK